MTGHYLFPVREIKENIVRVTRKIIHIDEEKCDGCGICIPSCAEGAIQIINGKARLIGEKYCDGLGACMGTCPEDAIAIIEREADEFEQDAVEAHLDLQQSIGLSEDSMPCGCPSTLIQDFSHGTPGPDVQKSMSPAGTPSALSHWPVQIRLVPPTAPFLKGADLLVAADCTPIAYADFHNDLLKGKVVLIGCPKFDDVRAYTEKFVRIFRDNHIRSLSAVVMEVPCCQGLPAMIQRAMTTAGKKIPMELLIISMNGERLDPFAAGKKTVHRQVREA